MTQPDIWYPAKSVPYPLHSYIKKKHFKNLKKFSMLYLARLAFLLFSSRFAVKLTNFDEDGQF